MSSTTTLNFDLLARDHASSTFRSFSGAVDSSHRSVGLLRGGVGRLVGAFAGLSVIYKTTQYLKSSVDEAREANKVGSQTKAVLTSTGRAANLTAKEVSNLADKLSLKAGIDDEAIQSGENLLLTFRNIRDEVGKGNDIFTQATRIGLDMSVALGKDLNSSTIMLGKALNDPIAGITALSRAGVQFTEDQKATIKSLVETGDTMGAQKMILRELNAEFKGSAKAQADPADKARVAWENLQETIGTKLLPVLNKVLIWFVKDGLPAIMAFGGWLKDHLGPVISDVAGWFSGASAEGGKLSTAFAGLVDAGKRLYEALKPVAIDIFEAIKRNWPQIKATVTDVLNSVSATVKAFAELVTTVWDKWGDDIMQATGRVWQHVGTQIKSALRVIQGIIQVVTGIIKGDWSQVWDGLKNIVGGAVDSIKGYVRNLVGNAKQALSGLGSALKSIITGAWDKAKDATVTGIGKVVHWVSTLPTKIKRAIGNLGQLLYEAGRDVIQGLIDGVQSKLGELADTMGNVVTGLKGAVTSGLGIFSPSKVMHKIGEQTMQGLIDGLDSKIANLRSKMAEITGTIKGSFTSPFDQGGSTALDLRAGANTNLQQATQFRNDLRKLTSKGVSDAVLNQLIGSGNFAAIHDLANSSRHEIDVLDRRTAATNRMLNQASNIAQNALGRDRLQSLLDQKRNLTDAVEDGFTRALDKRPGHRRQASRDLIRGAV